MGDKVSSITVVGGGDAGFLAALALRKVNPDVDIAVVDDFGEPPTEVGQGTFQSIIPLLHDVLGIDEGRFLREVKPVWKASSYFRDWCGYEPFHYAFDIRSVKPELDDPKSAESLYHYYETGDMVQAGGRRGGSDGPSGWLALLAFPGLEFLLGGLFVIGLVALWWLWRRE